jgi:putative transposase
VVIDLFSRKVVGWTVGDRLDADLSSEALQRALARRRPAPGLMFHSDRGVEFAAERFRTLLAQAGGIQP